jgi:glycosyltransferase involved in cell wall biosynthesis
MRVLMQIRPDAAELPGGDIIQLMKTKQYLEKIGVDVDVSRELEPNLQKYDLVHLFLLNFHFYENHKRYRNARKQGKRVVLSPIYWNPYYLITVGLRGFTNLKESIYYFLPNGVLRELLTALSHRQLNRELSYIYFTNLACMNLQNRKNQIEVLRSVDLILPNSRIEARLIMRDFGLIDESKFFVVPNAADRNFQNASPDSFVSKYGLRDFVLLVGRIEPHKNQLSLLRALKGSDLRLVLIGRPRGTTTSYFRKCRTEADENVLFIDWMKHEELASAYAAAKVHALPSWLETPGLVSLEAGIAGCNIVTTCEGSPREYFQQYAWYCDPRSIESIRQAVENAFAARKTLVLRKHILENFTWENTAQKTLEAYEIALNRKANDLNRKRQYLGRTDDL